MTNHKASVPSAPETGTTQKHDARGEKLPCAGHGDLPRPTTGLSERPRRIQRQRTKGWRMPEGAIYVGRPTQWGNPFKVGGPDWDQKQCVEMFRFTTCATDRAGIFTNFELSEIDLNPLRGKDLACWCQLDQPCHADVLLELANASSERPRAGAADVISGDSRHNVTEEIR